MIISMTGFARCESQTDAGTLTWELRTVNHRYLDISFRIPEDFRSLEPQFRTLIGNAVRRGKVEASLRYSSVATNAGPELDEDAVKRLTELEGRVAALVGGVKPLSTVDVLRWPGVLREQQADLKPMHEGAKQLLAETLQSLVETRQREGQSIDAVIASRVQGLEAYAAEVRAALPDIRTQIEARLRKRLEDVDVDVDSSRLEQELVISLQKGDVDEELDRLDNHLAELRACLVSEEAVGRRLDFLVQECNREVNTLGSKSQGLAVSKAAVEMKVLLEQIREQVQNSE